MSLTAFPEIEDVLKSRVKTIDHEAFRSVKIGSCASLFSQCSGMCCSLFVAVTDQEKEALENLCSNKKNLFQKIGLKIPSKVTAFDKKNNRLFLLKKQRRFKQFLNIVRGLLSAFKNSPAENLKLFQDFSYTCIFSMPSGECGLQKIAVLDGQHPWFYKPVNCWKYPLKIDEDGILSVYEASGNKAFPCHRDCYRNVCAGEALKEEIRFLSAIIGRDIEKEF